MKRFIKKVILIIAALVIVSTSVFAKADTEIQSGIYSMKNSVYHESDVGMSMARSYLDETMQAKITKEEVVFTIGFSGTQYMNNYRIKINGTETPVQVVEENKDAGTIKLQVSAPSKDVKISAVIYVDPMGRDVEFQVIPDYTSMTLIEPLEEKNEEVEEETSETSLEGTDEESSEEEVSNVEDSSKQYIKIAIPAVVVIIAIVLIVIFKKKK